MLKKIDLSFVLLVFLLCTICLGQLTRFSLFGITLYAQDILLIVAFLSSVIINPGTFTNILKKICLFCVSNKLIMAMGLWILVGWGIALSKSSLSLMAVLTTLRLVFYSLSTATLFSNLSKSKLWVSTGIFFTSFLMSILGIFQYLLLPDVRFLQIYGFDDHYYRLIGPLLDPNFAGLIVIIGWLFWQKIQPNILNWLKQQKLKSFASTMLSFLVEITLATALAMTFSRSSWLAFILVSIFLLISKKLNWKLVTNFFLKTVIVFCIVIILPKPTGEGVVITRTSTIKARAELGQELVKDWKPIEWIFGKGLFNVRLQNYSSQSLVPNTAWQPDNILLQIMGSLGLIGSLLVALLAYQRRRELMELSITTQALFVAIFIHAQFNNSFFQPQIWLLFTLGILADQKPQNLKTKLDN